VGNGPNQYQLWLGAAPNQTRLSEVYVEKMHIDDLETTLEPVFAFFKKRRRKDETLGDFCHRLGFDAIRAFAATYGAEPTGRSIDLRKRVTLRDATYLQLQQVALAQGTSMADLATELIHRALNPESTAE